MIVRNQLALDSQPVVLCFSHLPWAAGFQRPQQLMSRFASENKVIFFEEPEVDEATSESYLKRNVCDLSGVCVVRPVLSPSVRFADRDTEVRRLLDELVSSDQIDRPLLWYYALGMQSFSDHITARAVVHDCLAELVNASPGSSSLPVDEDALASASVVLTDDAELYQLMCNAHHEVHLVPGAGGDGADASHWDSAFHKMREIVQRVSVRKTKSFDPRFNVLTRRSAPPFDDLIVGAGFAGSVLAERLARGAGRKVLVVDRRPHIGGNAYDEYDAAGILVHKYGPHIFHTNSERIIKYLSQFTLWRPYEHRVLASVGSKLLPMPINRTTLNQLYDLQLAPDEDAAAFLCGRAESLDKVESAEDQVVSAVGRDLYETFFRGYTRKQWGVDPSKLDRAVTARVPARTSTDDRYFTDTYQCMPLHGYTRMFENMVDHDGISLALGVDFADLKHERLASRIIYSGPVDEYFGYRYGKLPYRSLRFEHVTVNQAQFQPVAVVNFPAEDVAYTRITEYKHLTGQQHASTSLTFEYPCDTGDPYYPVPNAANHKMYSQYQALAEHSPSVTFVGRLGTYRYYNMDQVVGQALTSYTRLTSDAPHIQTAGSAQLASA